MAGPRLNPTLFDKLVADLDLQGLRDETDPQPQLASREQLRFYTVPKIERFNAVALKNTVRRELAWLLNTTHLGASIDLAPYPQIATSVLNYGVPDLAGRTLTRGVVQARAREIRQGVVTFEPRLAAQGLQVEPVATEGRENAVTYLIRGDITAAVEAMPVEFKTVVDIDTADVEVRE